MDDDQSARRKRVTTSFYRGRPRAALPFLAGGLSVLALLVLLPASSGCSRKSAGGQGGRPSGPLTPGMAVPTPPAQAGYVTNNGSDSLSVIDREGAAVTSVPVDLDPDAREAPHHLAVDSAGQAVFVALAFPPEARKAGNARDPHASHGNASNAGKLARLDLATLAIRRAVDVDENPGDVVLTHDRRRVLVTHFDMKRAMDVAARGGGSPSTMFAHLVVLDAKDLGRVGSRAICVAPHGMTVTRDDRTAFIACYGSDELAVIDLGAEGFPTSRVPLGATQGVPGVPRYGPYSATLSPDETRVVVADLEGQDVRIFDRASKRFAPGGTVPLAAKAFMPAFLDDHTILVPLQSPDGLARVDLDAGKVTRRRSFEQAQCGLPHVVRVAKDGRIYLVCEGDHRAPGTVLELDGATLDVKRQWTVGVYPDGLAFGDE
ncbi:MAG: Surface antigen protein [Labilithrix sp.]|nr:Surface antigen protein [Labilithrix sp.]